VGLDRPHDLGWVKCAGKHFGEAEGPPGQRAT
jgi:hypothetical protein